VNHVDIVVSALTRGAWEGSMAGRMQGKKAVVVGAGQPPHEKLGNGRAIALLLAREGAEVCAVDRDRDRAQATVDQITDEGGRAHLVVADIAVPEDCARLVEDARTAMGRIDALVNNVGTSHGDADPLTLDVDGWQGIMDVNLRGTWLTSRAVVPIMRAQGGGTITNTSSVGSRTGGGSLFAYSVSKAGVNAVTHVFAVTYAPWGIRANAVLPSWVVTPHALAGLVAGGIAENEAEIMALGERSVPLGFMGDAMDVANTVLFLSSDESRFITGLEVPVDGGTLAVIGRYQRRPDSES
jgi:NAD(P)-dependent dehydrogenase (short-subunit alcohol dehydrogenase family)